MTEITTDNGIIEITVDDEHIDQDKYDNILEEFRSQIEQHGKIKVIEVVEQFPDFDPALLWDDLKFSYENMDNITHCAVVSEKGWVGSYARMIGLLVRCDIRVFDDLDVAREWIRSVG